MQRRQVLIGLLSSGGVVAGLSGLSGCGTLLHHERVGQPHSRDIDWKIAALDGLGLLLFFVPGVAAFAVDFYTGAIYLPSRRALGQHEGARPATGSTAAVELERINVAEDRLTLKSVEEAVSTHLRQSISLEDEGVRVSKLAQIDRFHQQWGRHRQQRDFGIAPQRYFMKAQPA